MKIGFKSGSSVLIIELITSQMELHKSRLHEQKRNRQRQDSNLRAQRAMD